MEGAQGLVGLQRHALFGEDSESAQFAMIKIADIHRRVLQFNQGGRDEGGTRGARHFPVEPIATAGGAGPANRLPSVSGKEIPFVQMVLGFGETMGIQKSPDSPGARGEFRRVGRVAMPGEEIQRHVVLPAHGQKLRRKLRGHEFTFDEMTAGSERRAADLQGRELPLDGERSDAIEPQVVVVRPGPHGRAVFGFVPDLPMADVVMESVSPALVVVPDNAEADCRPFLHVGGRMDMTLHAGVLDALAQSIDRFCAGLAHRVDVFVGQPEIIALR